MPNQDTITLHLGEITVPLQVVQELVKRHLLRTLRLASNGHSPDPAADIREEPAPALAGTGESRSGVSAGAP